MKGDKDKWIVAKRVTP